MLGCFRLNAAVGRKVGLELVPAALRVLARLAHLDQPCLVFDGPGTVVFDAPDHHVKNEACKYKQSDSGHGLLSLVLSDLRTGTCALRILCKLLVLPALQPFGSQCDDFIMPYSARERVIGFVQVTPRKVRRSHQLSPLS